ncbi:MAG: CBS domain-containing protein [Planctomycetes bacterium]|nr:CBS domain-containing protein [Planctomycetota bacterium]
MLDVNKVKARDLMRHHVVQLTAGMQIVDALRVFEEAKISGAPVTDSSGALVGVLSLKDVARPERMRAAKSPEENPGSAWNAYNEDEFDEDEILAMDEYQGDNEQGETVGDWMNPEVVAVTPDASVKLVCETLVDHGVHRVLVVEKGRLVGILTNSDVVRYLARVG